MIRPTRTTRPHPLAALVERVLAATARPALLIGLPCLLMTGALGWLVALRRLAPLDRALVEAAQTAGNPAFDYLGVALSLLGAFEVTSLIMLGWSAALLVRRRPWAALALLGMWGVVAVEVVLKRLVAQPGPGEFGLLRTELVGQIYAALGFPSATVDHAWAYPSGHVARTAFLVGLAAAFAGWRGLAARLGAALLGLVVISRVYLGEHWPTDVLGGLLLAVAGLSVAVPLAGLDRRLDARPRPSVARSPAARSERRSGAAGS